MRTTLAILGLIVPAAACMARPDTVTIDLTGVVIKDRTAQSRTSAPATLTPGKLYKYHIEAMVKGQSGLLALAFPDPVSLADVMEQLSPGSSALLDATVCNPSGTHPITFIDQRFEGSAVGVTLALDMLAGVRADSVAFFELNNVSLTPAFIAGSMIVTTGKAVLSRVACPPDLTGDGVLDVRDFSEFQNTFALGGARADFNCDGVLDIRDFSAFQNAFALGCP